MDDIATSGEKHVVVRGRRKVAGRADAASRVQSPTMPFHARPPWDFSLPLLARFVMPSPKSR